MSVFFNFVLEKYQQYVNNELHSFIYVYSQVNQQYCVIIVSVYLGFS